MPIQIAHPLRMAAGIGVAVILAGAVAALAVLVHARAQRPIVAAPSIQPATPAPAEPGHVARHVGPGPVRTTVNANGYALALAVQPNGATTANSASVKISRDGRPVTDARVAMSVAMLDMAMGAQSLGDLPQTTRGRYTHRFGALGMEGRWALRFSVRPSDGRPFTVVVVDRLGP